VRAWAGVAISIAAMVFLAVVQTLLPGSPGADAGMMLGFGVFLVICIGLYLRHARRCRQRMAAYEEALSALFDASRTD
jgi:L-asparagine transporter-like permease